MIYEILYSLFHPNIFLMGVTFKTNPSIFLVSVEYEVNDFLLIILLTRVYVFYRFYISCTRYFDARAERVAKLFGHKLSRIFAFRCLMEKKPYFFFITTFLTFVMVFAYMLKIIEGPLYYDGVSGDASLHNDYSKLENCIWNVVITMTTVGYGDYFPVSNLGRLIVVITSIVGNAVTSLIVFSVSVNFKLTPREFKVYHFCERLNAKTLIERCSANLFSTTFKLLVAQNKLKKACLRNVPNEVKSNLKSDVINKFYRRVISKKEFKKKYQ
jgi:hypothetical protein